MIGRGAEQESLDVRLGLPVGVFTALGRELGEAGLVERCRVGEAREHEVGRVELEVTRRLDRREQVADRGDAEQREPTDEIVRDAAPQERLAPGGLVEHPE